MSEHRPLRKRIWFYKPYPGYLKPEDGFFLPKGWWHLWSKGGDEFNWHTLVIGNPVTGCVVIATKECDGKGRCAEDLAEFPDLYDARWPIDAYGHNHEGACTSPDCYCREASA